MIRMHYSESESKLNFMCRIIKLHTKTHGKKNTQQDSLY